MLRNGLIGAAALIALAIGVVGMSVLAGLREPPQRLVVDDPGPLVRAMSVEPQDVPLTVTGFVTVRAKHTWSVVPEVSGAVLRLSPNMRAGRQANSRPRAPARKGYRSAQAGTPELDHRLGVSARRS